MPREEFLPVTPYTHSNTSVTLQLDYKYHPLKEIERPCRIIS